MCQFQDDFLLCTCIDRVEANQIDWILRRRDPESKKRELQITHTFGVRGNLDHFEEIHKEAYQRYREEIFKRVKEAEKEIKARDKKKEEILNSKQFQDTALFILSQINSRNCFDQEIDLQDKDVLSIKLNVEFGLWADFMYRRGTWRVAKFSLDANRYSEIVNGQIQKDKSQKTN